MRCPGRTARGAHAPHPSNPAGVPIHSTFPRHPSTPSLPAPFTAPRNINPKPPHRETSCPPTWRTAVRQHGDHVSAYKEFLLSLTVLRMNHLWTLLDAPAPTRCLLQAEPAQRRGLYRAAIHEAEIPLPNVAFETPRWGFDLTDAECAISNPTSLTRRRAQISRVPVGARPRRPRACHGYPALTSGAAAEEVGKGSRDALGAGAAMVRLPWRSGPCSGRRAVNAGLRRRARPPQPSRPGERLKERSPSSLRNGVPRRPTRRRAGVPLELAALAEPVFRPAPPKHPEPLFFNATRIPCSSGHMLA